MIRSMTGFGRASFTVADVVFEIESRSVNHRHAEVRLRVPRLLTGFEAAARQRIQARIGRGKVDVAVSTPAGASALQRVEIDFATAREYARVAAELQESAGVAGPLSVDALFGLPGVAGFAERDLPVDELEAGFLGAIDAAVEALDAMRVAEGAALEKDLFARVETVGSLLDALEARSDVVAEAARVRLRKRAEQLKQETGILDEARLHQEIVIAADRMDITEEVVRLRSHIDQLKEIVATGNASVPVGRRLDFLMQEFGREANTIGSKSSDSPVAHHVVALKTEIERIREQVQNVE
jgi:uncharacterized protein (TIGR00255 family)